MLVITRGYVLLLCAAAAHPKSMMMCSKIISPMYHGYWWPFLLNFPYNSCSIPFYIWFIRENPIKIDDLGVPHLWKPPCIYIYIHIYIYMIIPSNVTYSRIEFNSCLWTMGYTRCRIVTLFFAACDSAPAIPWSTPACSWWRSIKTHR